MGWVLPVRGVVTLLVLLAILLLTKPVSSGSCWLFKPIDSLTGQGRHCVEMAKTCKRTRKREKKIGTKGIGDE